MVHMAMPMKVGSFEPETEVQAPALEPDPVADAHGGKHRWLESKPVLFTGLATVAVLIGGAVEAIPMMLIRTNAPTISSVEPYTPLEVLGRDIYIREGCVGCHSQMVRPFRSETERYGEYSKSGEFVYDHPFLWGSKRTGPDLHRIGRKYPDSWHYYHMLNPQDWVEGSIMPPYPWLIDDELDTDVLPGRIKALRTVGVPYPEGYELEAIKDLREQAEGIAESLRSESVPAEADREIIALIAYLQRLGTDIRTDQD